MKLPRLVLGLGIVTMTLATASAFAGRKWVSHVYVSASSRVAYGSAGDARAASDGNEYIGCYISQQGTTSEFIQGYCEAEDASGNFQYCFLPSGAAASYAKVIATTGSNSYYYFTWDATGACNSLDIDSSSPWPPMTP
jgi:hypothetical protein